MTGLILKFSHSLSRILEVYGIDVLWLMDISCPIPITKILELDEQEHEA